MSETRKEVKEQFDYMKKLKKEYLKEISIDEYNKRLEQMREFIYNGTKNTW